MRYAVFNEGSQNSEQAILLPNHLAASLDDAMGDRAHYLSLALGMTVIAYERPSTADQLALPPFNAESYLTDAAVRATELQDILDDGGFLEAVGIGSSAAALDTLAVAASGNANVTQIVAVEPAGMRRMSPIVEMNYLRSQLERDRADLNIEEFQELPELGDIREKISGMPLARRMLKERDVYGDVFRGTAGMIALRKVALLGIPTTLVLGEKSLTTTPKLRVQMSAEFAGSSVKIEVLPGAKHSFADRTHYLVHIVKKALQPLIVPDSDIDLERA